MSIFLYTTYTILHLCLLIWGLQIWVRTRSLSVLITVAVTFGLIYDNLVLALGSFLAPGDFLYFISLPRFVLHQLFLPWIIYASFLYVRMAGVDWAVAAGRSKWIIWLSFFVMIMGIITRIVPLKLEPVAMDGINRYVFAAAKGPPIVSVVAIGFAAIMGFFLWRKLGWVWVFLTSVLVFVGEAIPVEMIRRSVGSGGEVLFIFAMLGTAVMLYKTRTNLID